MPRKKKNALGLTTKQTIFGVILIILLLGIINFPYLPLKKIVPNSSQKQSLLPTVTIGGDFSLIDQYGKSRTQNDFNGQWTLVYFGFSHCPDICPTDLAVISLAMEMLGRDADHLQPIFITVDPARDTSAVLKEFMQHFHPKFIALTGEKAAIDATVKAYRAYATQSKDDAGNIVIGHSGMTYLMNPEGEFVRHFPHGTDVADFVAGLKVAL